MKFFLLTLLSFFQLFAFSQDRNLHTYTGKPVNNRTCIFQIQLVDLIPIDTFYNEVRKPGILKFISYLTACSPEYTFDKRFQDKEFRLAVPKYLTKVSYELGDQHFSIVLSDTTSFGRAIAFSYDLDNSYKNHFLSHDNMGFKKIDTIRLNSQTIHRYINWDNKMAGVVFTSNHLRVSYFTKSKDYETELAGVISKFNW